MFRISRGVYKVFKFSCYIFQINDSFFSSFLTVVFHFIFKIIQVKLATFVLISNFCKHYKLCLTFDFDSNISFCSAYPVGSCATARESSVNTADSSPAQPWGQYAVLHSYLSCSYRMLSFIYFCSKSLNAVALARPISDAFGQSICLAWYTGEGKAPRGEGAEEYHPQVNVFTENWFTCLFATGKTNKRKQCKVSVRHQFYLPHSTLPPPLELPVKVNPVKR